MLPTDADPEGDPQKSSLFTCMFFAEPRPFHIKKHMRLVGPPSTIDRRLGPIKCNWHRSSIGAGRPGTRMVLVLSIERTTQGRRGRQGRRRETTVVERSHLQRAIQPRENGAKTTSTRNARTAAVTFKCLKKEKFQKNVDYTTSTTGRTTSV